MVTTAPMAPNAYKLAGTCAINILRTRAKKARVSQVRNVGQGLRLRLKKLPESYVDAALLDKNKI